MDVFDVSMPINPRRIGEVEVGTFGMGYAPGVAAIGTHAYRVDTEGLHVIDLSNPVDITNPAVPRLVGTHTGPSFGVPLSDPTGIAVFSDYVCVAAGYRGLQVFGIDLPPPETRLSADLLSGGLRLRWLSTATGFALESSADPTATTCTHEDPFAQNRGRSDPDGGQLTGTAAVIGS